MPGRDSLTSRTAAASRLVRLDPLVEDAYPVDHYRNARTRTSPLLEVGQMVPNVPLASLACLNRPQKSPKIPPFEGVFEARRGSPRSGVRTATCGCRGARRKPCRLR